MGSYLHDNKLFPIFLKRMTIKNYSRDLNTNHLPVMYHFTLGACLASNSRALKLVTKNAFKLQNSNLTFET